MGILSYVKIGIVAAVILAVGIGYWHHRSVLADLSSAQAAVATLTLQRDAAVATANANAAAAKKADEDRLRVVAELEAAQQEIAASAVRDEESLKGILTAPADEDGDVAPLLERLRSSRFGGQQ